jgi:hypothetical protein
MRTDFSRRAVEFEKMYINAWCQTHRSLNPGCPKVVGFNIRIFEGLMVEYFQWELGLGGFENDDRLHLWYAYRQAGFHPYQLVGNTNPLFFPERYASRWSIGDPAWTEREKVLGRPRNLIINDDLSSIHSAEAIELSQAQPPGQRRFAFGQGQKNVQRSHGSEKLAYSSEDYESSSDSSMNERTETRAHHREHTGQGSRQVQRDHLHDAQSNLGIMDHSSSSNERSERDPASHVQTSTNLPAHDDHRVARPGRVNSRPEQSSDQVNRLTTQQDLEMFEQFIQLQGLNSERSAALRQRLTNDVSTSSGSTTQHDVQQPSRGSVGTTSFVQSPSLNDQSTLGNDISLSSNRTNSLMVVPGFANGDKTHCY